MAEERHAKNINISDKIQSEEIPMADENAVDQSESDDDNYGSWYKINSNSSCGFQWRRKLSNKKLLQRQKSCTELSREEAWIRRRRDHDKESRAVSRSVSDCGERTWPHARCLRDEDLEELRGCIDLGFRFSLDQHHRDELCNTFPALDLYYAINRQYNVSKSKSSPESSVHESESCGVSPSSPLFDTWIISSPGEDSQEVKTKLRHWAQVVACSVRQSC